MKRTFLLITALVFVLSALTFALDITMDAQRDAFYDTMNGPENGALYLDYTSSGINQGGVLDNEDLSATVWFAWDTTYFYCYAEINDELVQVNNATQYENDALELKMDPDPAGIDEATTGVAAIRLSALSADDAEVPGGVHDLNSGEMNSGDWAPVVDEDYARDLTETGYNLEFRIPFEAIVTGERFVTAEVNGFMGMALNVMDNDNLNRESVLRWASNMDDVVWNEPKRHGTVTFLEGNYVNLSTENYITGVDTNSIDYSLPDVAVEDQPSETPAQFELAQNYPNPFNPTTTIEFSLPKTANVTLNVYNLIGVKVASLVNNQVMSAGTYNYSFDASDLNSGIYVYKLQAGENVMSHKMMVIK